MERAIVHSDLSKNEIQPQALITKYRVLLEKDIHKLLPVSSLEESNCPVSGEVEFHNSFSKMGMDYRVSSSFENIYLSPRPSMEKLRAFYLESEARKLWITKLWPETKSIRIEKIIHPQLEWIQDFLSQFDLQNDLDIAEFLPNHWGYWEEVEKKIPNVNYIFIDPLFNSKLAGNSDGESLTLSRILDDSLDVALLFEAMDRSPDPAGLLGKVKQGLKPGGLCFVTCLLSSGFEVQVLGKYSDVFVPPERMNLLSFEGLNSLIEKTGGLELLEFSTPGVLDIPNIVEKLDDLESASFFNYLFRLRKDPSLVESFQDFLQLNRLGTYGRLVLRKQ